ncbi:unnamed protein product [Sphagnum jensenii]|uniref:Glycosyltransferase n=1 Tax=Sphagnum jensenii TaxID=128206 RepID=A0ABP0XIC4_9BRYO
MTSHEESNHVKAGAHVVAFPIPAGGHHARFVPFVKLLARNGLTITVITTTNYLAKMQQSLVESNSLEVRHNIRVVGFDLPPEYSEIKSDTFLTVLRAVANLKDPLRHMMKELMEYGLTNGIDESPDSHLLRPPDIADEFNLPRYSFYPSTHFLSLVFSLREFNAQGRLPPKDGAPFMIPGFAPILPSDLPKSLLHSNAKLVYEGERLREATGVLVNTAYELESSIIDGLQEMLRKESEGNEVLAPFFPNQKIVQQAAEDDNVECLHWLTEQPEASVLYICLGSMSTFPTQQIGEFASGLEASGVHFLWVLKVPSSEESAASYIATFLPEGFIERTKDRGLIYTSWAPQLQILANPATGGYLTQCGWNSITESIAMGVPMIGWPIWADHMLNRILCVDVLDIALSVPNASDDATLVESSTLVGHEEIERVIRLLMGDTRGQVIKKNVEELSKIVEMATRPEGSSWKNLLHFLEEVNSLSLINK